MDTRLGEALALAREGAAKQAQALGLLEEGAALFQRANEVLAPYLEERTPCCPSCGKRMALKVSHRIPGATSHFWSCPSWEAHKRKGEKSTMTYEAWLKSLTTPPVTEGGEKG